MAQKNAADKPSMNMSNKVNPGSNNQEITGARQVTHGKVDSGDGAKMPKMSDVKGKIPCQGK